MANTAKNLEPAFQGAGQRVGLEIWRIENFQPVALPKADYGKFYSGDSYIVLQTSAGRGGAYLYDIHFWLGKETSQVPFARSSLNHDDVFILDTENKIYQFNGSNSNIQERAKALEVVQYLKDKYHDGTCDVAIIDDGKLEAESGSGEFWVLFGGFAPIGRKTVSEDDIPLEATPAKLYSINEGELKLEDGPLTKAMLENSKCYLLDCGAEIFVWVGRITQVDDRKSACKTAEDLIANENRPKTTRITRVIQGFETHSFKSNFESWPASSGTATNGGDEGRGKVAALLKQQGVDLKGTTKSAPANEEVPPLLEGGGKLEVWRINGSAKSPVLPEDIGKFYSGDCYIVLYTYPSGDRKDDYFLSCWMGKDSIQDDQIMATRLANTMCTSLKGRPVLGRILQGKEPPQFIALFQPMVVLKGGLSSGYKKYIAENNLNDDTYTSDGIALFRVSGTSVHNNKTIQVDAVATSLCSADCFLLQSGSTMFNWHGSSSTFEQQQWAAKLAELLKPGVTLKHAKEGTESSAFWFALGGKQSFTTKKVVQDIVRDPHLYSYSFNKGKLEVSEIFNFSQEDLLTEDILLLDTHSEVFVWVGHSVGSKEKQEALNIGQKYIELAAALEGLPADVPLYKVTEGNEPCFFTTYFSWDGTKAAVKGNSFQKKLSQLFGSAMNAAESNDKSNNSPQGGPRQRAEALAALTSAFNPSSNPRSKSYGSTQGSYTQRAEALAALSSAFNPSAKEKAAAPKPTRSSGGSQRAAAVAALSTVLTAEQRREQSEAAKGRLSRGSSLDAPNADEASSETTSPLLGDVEESPVTGDPLEISVDEGTGEEGSISYNNGAENEENDDSQTADEGQIFSYERLRAKSRNPVRGIDYKRRETYLSDAEFETVFGLTKDAFYQQPKWKQDMQKRKLDLF
ncbi:uncharacterized protein A4U43_C02F18270 [Asparagus officinalis]|uniref:HP domain-containing protein n=1 Tax=Asparagus officinalis TaxID=4686 RepID=A0A5P1FN45_ASPOF|nr:uncharacterized protein A4U43_C02F18270 [Asparagus officinalis]